MSATEGTLDSLAPTFVARHTSSGDRDVFDLFVSYPGQSGRSLRGTWCARSGVEADALVAAFAGGGITVEKATATRPPEVEVAAS